MKKKLIKSPSLKKTVLSTLCFSALFSSLSISASTLNLRILETSDVHANMMDFDYYTLKPTEQFGLTRTATLINKARAESQNSVLIDNGDLIQGSPLGDFFASKGLSENEIHPIIDTLNFLGYTVATVGNHEFNYGLEYLNTVLKAAKYPVVNANIYDQASNKPYFTPYIIQPTTLKDDKGDSVTLNIGYIGFVAPKITSWDKQHLDGKVYTEDIIESAKKWVPEMKNKGADIIVAINHSGIDAEGYEVGMENAGYYLTEVENIDVVLTGHSHGVFPSERFNELPNTDLAKGLINGIPVTMPGYFGSHLGVIDLTLEQKNQKWEIINSQATARPIFDKDSNKPLVDADPELTKRLSQIHQQTIDFVNQPIGKTSQPIYGYLALVQDAATLQIINDAQAAFVNNHLKNNPELESLPVLSAAAPFKAGGRDGYALSYTAVDEGLLTYRNAADIYVFPNTLTVVKASGAEVKDWLECSAGVFNQIDKTITTPQPLINYETFRTYNFDVIDGVSYEIDVTQPSKFDGDCQLINPEASRIMNLTFEGKPIDEKASFYVVTNNYRGFGGKFAGTGSDKVAIALPEENRTIIADYITAQSEKNGELTIDVDNNWRLAPITSDTNLDIRINVAGNDKANQFINKTSLWPLKSLKRDPEGIEEYQIILQNSEK